MAERRDFDFSRPNDWDNPTTDAGRKYKAAVERAAALQFLAQTFDKDNPEEAARIRSSIPDIKGYGESYAPRGDSTLTASELEGFQHQADLARQFYPAGEEARDKRHAELERLGRMPTFRAAPLTDQSDHADSDDATWQAAQKALQTELENYLHSLHGKRA